VDHSAKLVPRVLLEIPEHQEQLVISVSREIMVPMVSQDHKDSRVHLETPVAQASVERLDLQDQQDRSDLLDQLVAQEVVDRLDLKDQLVRLEIKVLWVIKVLRAQQEARERRDLKVFLGQLDPMDHKELQDLQVRILLILCPSLI